MCSILIFSVNHQGHLKDSGLLEILNITNVRIDTLDQVYSMYTAGAKKGHSMDVWMTSSSRVNR